MTEEELEEKGHAEVALAAEANLDKKLLQRKGRLLLSFQPQHLSPVEILTGAMKMTRMKKKRTSKQNHP